MINPPFHFFFWSWPITRTQEVSQWIRSARKHTCESSPMQTHLWPVWRTQGFSQGGGEGSRRCPSSLGQKVRGQMRGNVNYSPKKRDKRSAVRWQRKAQLLKHEKRVDPLILKNTQTQNCSVTKTSFDFIKLVKSPCKADLKQRR